MHPRRILGGLLALVPAVCGAGPKDYGDVTQPTQVTVQLQNVPPKAVFDEIARQTGQPIGEVELIVGLYRQLHPSRGATQHVRPQ